jgi:hypothetical protein
MHNLLLCYALFTILKMNYFIFNYFLENIKVGTKIKDVTKIKNY